MRINGQHKSFGILFDQFTTKNKHCSPFCILTSGGRLKFYQNQSSCTNYCASIFRLKHIESALSALMPFFVCVAAVIKAETLTAFTPMLQWTQVQKLTQVLMSVFRFVSNGRCVNHTAAWIAARIDEESISHIRIKVQQRSSPAFMSCKPCDKYVSKCHCTDHFPDVSVFGRLFELTESLYDLLAPCLGTKHQYPSLGMQLLINNSNVINNSCEVTHLCLCQPSITLDCTIKTEWIKVIHMLSF